MKFIDYEIPDWIKKDKARRQEMIKEIRQKSRKPYLAIVLLVAIVVGLLWYSIASAQTITYIAEKQIARVEKVLAIVTAYTSSVDETDSRPWETASGSIAGYGSVACPDRLAFGTRVVIDGKEYTCDDRMNIRYRDGDHFDIWKETKAKAFIWGRQVMEVEIL